MKRLIVVIGVLILVVVSAGQVFAGQIGGRTIGAGETHQGDLEIIGDSLTIEGGGTVNGDVTVLGGNADIAGIVNGDMSILGGNVHLSGIVDGDVFVLGGNLSLDDEAMLEGECVLLGGNLDKGSNVSVSCSDIGTEIRLGVLSEFPDRMDIPEPPPPDLMRDTGFRVRTTVYGILSGIGEAVGRTLLLGAFAWMIAAVWPHHLARVSTAVQERPFASGAVGLLTTGAFVSLITILAVVSALLLIVCVGLLGFPLIVMMSFAFLAAVIMGWVSMGAIVGSRLARPLNLSKNEQVNVTVTGTLLITLVLGLFSGLPSVLGTAFLADAVTLILAFIGLGAAAMTKLGREVYPAPAGEYRGKADIVIEEDI